MAGKKEIWILFLLAILFRLIALPFSQIVEADATARLFIAEHAVRYGGELSSLQWQSLHIYLLSFAQLISGERYWGPVVLSLILVAASVIPFYLFTRNIFSREGAFFTALIFIFSPLVFRLSFTPLSEGFHLAFCLTAIWCISEGILNPERKIRWALFAGIAATIACGGRFEAWIIAALLGLILLVLRQWKMALIYGIVSSVFPVFWLIYCNLKTGSALVSIEMVQYFNFNVARVNDKIDEAVRLKRILFFPLSWFVALTPPAAAIILLSVWKILRRPFSNLPRLLFTLLFIFWFVFFIWQSLNGSLFNQHRFTITLIMLSLPLYACWFENKSGKIKKAISIGIAVLGIPWSFYWQNLPWQKMALGNENGKMAIALAVSGTHWEMQAVPKIPQQEFETFASRIDKEIRPGDGVFTDWTGWINSFYIGHRAPVPAEDIFISCEDNPVPVNYEYFKIFFDKHAEGLILFSDLSLLSTEISLHGPLMEMKTMPEGFLLDSVLTQGHYRLFRYKRVSAEETKALREKYADIPPPYTIKKDADYFRNVIRFDGNWTAGLWLNAKKEHITMEEQIRRASEYMEDEEKRQEQQSDSLNRNK